MTPDSPPKSSLYTRLPEIIVFTVLIGIGAWLRLGWVGISHFALDEVNISLPALQMARGEAFVFLGTFSSVGVPFFPAGTWIFVPPFLFSSDPLIATLYVGMLNLLALIGLYALVRKVFSVPSALVALGIAATAPYAVIHSRFIWQPNVLIPVVVAWLLALEASASSDRRPHLWTVLTIFIAGLAVQIHFAGIGLVVATAFYALYARWWKRWRACILGGLSVIALTIPFFGYLACCGDPVLSAISDTAAEPAVVDLQAIDQFTRVGLSYQWQEKLIGDLATDATWYAQIATSLTTALLVLGVLAVVQNRATPSQKHLLVAIGCLLASMIVVFLRHSSPVRFYYMLPIIPALAVLIGASWRLVPLRVYQMAISLACAAIIAASTTGLAQHLNIAATEATPHGIGVPLAYTRDVANAFPNENVVYHTHGDSTLRTGQAMIFEAYWWGQDDRRVVNGANLLVLPSEPSVLLFELAPFQAYEEVVAAGLVQTAQTLPRRENEPPFMYTRVDGNQPLAGYTTLDEPVAFSHGVTLTGWQARTVGPRLRISTIWQVDSALPEATVQQFHHLYVSEDGMPVGDSPLRVSDVGLSVSTWRVGDRVIVMGDFFLDDLPTSETSYQVIVGHYDLATGVRYALADSTEDSITLPAFDSTTLSADTLP